MKRRSFIEHTAGLIGLGAAAANVRASMPRPAPLAPTVPLAPAVAVTPTPLGPAAGRAIELQRSPLAGFQYHQGVTLWPSLRVGAALDLVREPDNAYDPRAVRVDWQGRKLGYLPRLDNAAASQLLDRGQPLRAEIVELRDSHNPWERVGFAIFLVDRG